MRCPGRPSLRTIPLQRFSPVCDPRVPGNFVGPSPTDGALAVFRFSDAMRCVLDVGTCVACGDRNVSRRVNAAAKCCAQVERSSAIVRAGAARGNRCCARRTIRHIKRHRFTGTRTTLISVVPLIRCPEPGHAPTRSLARCSATERLEPSRPGRATGPSLRSPGGAHGVQRPFAGLFPPAGDRSSLIDRAHKLFALASSARFVFVGLIAPLANMR